MARIKITQKTLKQKLTLWSQGKEVNDELIFFQNEIETAQWVQRAWEDNMIIAVESDSVAGFNKIVFKEKL